MHIDTIFAFYGNIDIFLFFFPHLYILIGFLRMIVWTHGCFGCLIIMHVVGIFAFALVWRS